MKKLIILFLGLAQISWAQNAFELGNQYYQKENYTAAISSFEGILTSGKQSAEVYFNLGNCFYKLHKVGPAIYNFEKALLLNPNDKELQTNLEFARKMAIDDIKVVPKVGFNKLIADFTSAYYYDTWAWIAIAFAFLFLAFFIGYYFSYQAWLKRGFFGAMFLGLLGIVISTAAGFYEKSRTTNEKPAIVFAEITSVKSEPKVTSSDVVVLHEGAKVFILESIANWKKVELTDETTGWIDENAIKEIKN
jgi:tetratricopeptide (TPR) repeat protein